MDKLSMHFRLDEFKCHDGTMPPKNFAYTIKDTLMFLESLRLAVNLFIAEKFGIGKFKTVGLIIVSGYRHEAYNKKCGGATNSRHVTGHAVDVKLTIPYGETTLTYHDFSRLAEFVDSYYESKPFRLGFYPSKGAGAWIHVDCAYGFGSRRWTK